MIGDVDAVEPLFPVDLTAERCVRRLAARLIAESNTRKRRHQEQVYCDRTDNVSVTLVSGRHPISHRWRSSPYSPTASNIVCGRRPRHFPWTHIANDDDQLVLRNGTSFRSYGLINGIAPYTSAFRHVVRGKWINQLWLSWLYLKPLGASAHANWAPNGGFRLFAKGRDLG